MIRSRKNQYRGINAHYQSFAQNQFNGWRSFHNVHITHLVELIQEELPPGYVVQSEESLKLHDTRRYTMPDVLVWDTAPMQKRAEKTLPSVAAHPTLTRDLEATLDEDENITAVVIRELRAGGESVPVTRVEVLSPSNKDREGRDVYLSLRKRAIQSSISMIELDYLHETDSPLPGIPGYASSHMDAHPYMVTVADVRPQVRKFLGYGFDVNQPFSPIEIPLVGDESFVMDFGAAYTYTLEKIYAFTNEIDYSQEPLNFQSYTPFDQQQLWAVMVKMVEAERLGRDLNQPQPAIVLGELLQKTLTSARQAVLLVNPKTLALVWLVHTPSRELLACYGRVENSHLVAETSVLAQGTETEISAAFQTAKSHFEQTGQFG